MPDRFVIFHGDESRGIEPQSICVVVDDRRRVGKTKIRVLQSGREVAVDDRDLQPIDPLAYATYQRGDAFTHKICNLCHRLLPKEDFSLNQRNQHGEIRRPSCKRCRKQTEHKKMSRAQREAFAKTRPPDGALFSCPICRKQTIVGVTAKIVLDHDHDTGRAHGWICESCNTGLGRLKKRRRFPAKRHRLPGAVSRKVKNPLSQNVLLAFRKKHLFINHLENSS